MELQLSGCWSSADYKSGLNFSIASESGVKEEAIFLWVLTAQNLKVAKSQLLLAMRW